MLWSSEGIIFGTTVVGAEREEEIYKKVFNPLFHFKSFGKLSTTQK